METQNCNSTLVPTVVSFEKVGLAVSFFDEATQRGYPAGQWLPIYNIRAWNSGNATSIILRIDNNNDVTDGNDFGMDDISFAELHPQKLEFKPPIMDRFVKVTLLNFSQKLSKAVVFQSPLNGLVPMDFEHLY